MLKSRRQDGEMTTAKAVESMSDAGAFEVLATRVLRQTDHDYARIEHLGVNADGKTIKNPLDGFCKIPGSNPSRYVMAAFSTDVVSNIRRKLLFDHKQLKRTKYKDSDDGDLVKAARKATTIRVNDCSAEFIFTFCTNKQPDDELMQVGYAEGEALGIEVRFLARSSIRDHLDTTSNGQWLRKEHLGITADMLSIPLLYELTKKSVDHYSYELFCSDSHIVETATTKRLASFALQSRPSVNFLIGPSGSGKSVASYKALVDVIGNGGIALWIPAEVIINSLSLEAAIATVLQSLYPTLGLNAGRESIALTTSKNIPFLLVVDDVNRTKNATQTIQKLIAWHRRITLDDGTKNSAQQKNRSPHLLIPIWNQYWSSIASRYRSDEKIGEMIAQPMTADEAIECLRVCSTHLLDQRTAFEVVKRLEYDPILIGLWGELHGSEPGKYLDIEASTLIETYIQRSIEEGSADSNFLAADIRIALESLVPKMLEERELYPSWLRLSEWLPDSQIAALRHLCISGRVCRLVHRNNVDRFEFRHDRLLETALAKPIWACLSDIEKNKDIVADPFFTDSIARAVVASDAAMDIVSKLRDYAPLAVLRTLRYVTKTNNTMLTTATVTAAKEWLIEAMTNNQTPPEIVRAASQILETTQDALVLTVTDAIKENRDISGARLVNGDAIRGKFFVMSHNIFFPSARAPFIEEVIARACRLHYELLCEELVADLNHGYDSALELQAALTLAGYIGETSLAEPALKAWKRQSKGNQCLLEALWASIRCSLSPEVTLSPMLDSWATLSDEKDQYGSSERDELLTDLGLCMRHGVNEKVIKLLVGRAERDDRLSPCLVILLKYIDHPLAVTFVSTRIAHTEKEIEGTESWIPWPLRRDWDPLENPENRLSDTSRNAILSLCNKSEEKWLQESLLRTWIATTDSAEELASIPSEFATSRSALWRRARFGDISITELVLKRMEEESDWWHVIPSIWTNQFIDPLDRALSALGKKTPTDFSGGWSNNHSFLSKVLRDIPIEVAEHQLLKHWESLKFSSQFIQSALYIGGESLLSAVEVAIKEAPDDWEPFALIDLRFGFNTISLKDRLADKHLNALLPYVARLHDMTLIMIGEWLVEHGRKHDFCMLVLPEINRRIEKQQLEGENPSMVRLRQRSFPTDADLLNALSKIEDNKKMTVWSWCREATERGDSPERIRTIFRTWLLEQPSLIRLRTIAKIVGNLGYREDMKELQKYQAEYGDESTKMLVDGAVFRVQYRTLS